MKKNLMIPLLCIAAVSVFAEPIEPYITISKEKEINRGIALKVEEGTSILPLFKGGVVMNTSGDEIDGRNFGRYVETFTELSYTVKGQDVKDIIFMVYSNMNSIDVKQGYILEPDSVLGTGHGPGTPIYPGSGDLYLYIYTLGQSPYLLKATGGRFIEDGDYIWWDPSFLIKSGDNG